MQVFTATDRGKVRPTNEDSFAVIEPAAFIVADGMGGQAAGEIASLIAVKTVRSFLAGKNEASEEILKEALYAANEEIIAAVKRSPEYKGMGTTATLMKFFAGTSFWAHVGDSRLYVFRAGNLTRLTRDHSYVEELVEKGSLTAEEARRHPRKNLLTRALGAAPHVDVDTGNFRPEPGDKFLLATDGLTNMIETETIKSILAKDGIDFAAELTAKALAGGGLDNITAVVAVYDNESYK